jgi:alpha-tubulin suppressor-like RCC1 family protein
LSLSNIIQTTCGLTHTLALNQNFQVYFFGNSKVSPFLLTLFNITQTSIGENFAIFLTSGGDVSSIGKNDVKFI